MDTLRYYQSDAVKAAVTSKENCLIVMPTASGKSHVIAGICHEYSDKRILILSHVKKILEQNYEKLQKYFSADKIGLYSAGLKSRERKQICVASIQTVYKRASEFMDYDIIIIDECHMVPPDGEGRYVTFLKAIGAMPTKEKIGRKMVEVVLETLKKVIGLSATPFRMKSGHLVPGPIFKRIAYKADLVKLMKEGFLSPVTSKAPSYQMDTAGIKKVAGDFSNKELSERLDRQEVTETICYDMFNKTKERKCGLIFAIDIEHAEHIAETLKLYGIQVEAVHSKMKGDPDKAIKDLKEGRLKCLVNVDMLTTGVDIPNIDFIVFMRPTQSVALYIQMIGRGFRLFEGKTDFLVLDYAGNVQRMGPVNDVLISSTGGKSEQSNGGQALTKVCPECEEIVFLQTKVCPSCEHRFPEGGTKLTVEASSMPVIGSRSRLVKYPVSQVFYTRHKKYGRPDSLKVTYFSGVNTFHEWIHIESHENSYHNLIAQAWWQYRAGTKMPKTTLEALNRQKELKTPVNITVLSGEYPQVTRVELENGRN